MNELEELCKKRDLLMKELQEVNREISQHSNAEDIIMLQNKLAEIRDETNKKNTEINQDVLDMKSSMSEDEWFAYMGYAERRKALNQYEGALTSCQLKKSTLEKQIAMKVGNLQKASEELGNVQLELGTLPIYVERTKLRVKSSKQYYQMVSGKITRMDYETWLLGNKKVQSGEDEDYVRNLKDLYKGSLETKENIEDNQTKSHI